MKTLNCNVIRILNGYTGVQVVPNVCFELLPCTKLVIIEISLLYLCKACMAETK